MGDGLATVPLGANQTARSVVTGGWHSCAILDSHEVKCWGLNSDGQLGIGNMMSHGVEPGEMGDNLPTVDL
jgi:alpha-tubulin suppressor-like RCC1 family protein